MLMNASFNSLVKTIILLQFLTTPSLFVKGDIKLIYNTCKKTPNSALCVSTLKSDPKSLTADVAELGFIVVEAVKAKSTKELSSITQLSNSDPKMKPRLSECLENYKIILSDLIPEAEATIGGNPKFAEDGMVGVMQIADECAQTFEGLPISDTHTNQLVHDLSDIAVSIIKTLL